MRHHEVLSDLKNLQSQKQCSVMFRNTLLRYFANNTHITVLFTYIFFAILYDFRSLNIKLIFLALSAMTDIVSVSVIVEPLLSSLDFYDTLSNIQSCNFERHQTRHHHRYNRQSINSESEYYDCVLIMLYALAISVHMSDLRSSSMMVELLELQFAFHEQIISKWSS